MVELGRKRDYEGGSDCDSDVIVNPNQSNKTIPFIFNTIKFHIFHSLFLCEMDNISISRQ